MRSSCWIDRSSGLIPAIVFASFVLGFAVADVTDVRALGGLVLLAGAVVCARLALPRAGGARTAVLLVIALALFVLSHPLGHAIGTWPAVLVTAALAAAASAALVT